MTIAGPTPQVSEHEGVRNLRPMMVAFVAALILLSGGTWAYEQVITHSSRYERRCIEHASDIGLCSKGRAAEPRRRCERGEQPPGTEPMSMAQCVQAWLAYEG